MSVGLFLSEMVQTVYFDIIRLESLDCRLTEKIWNQCLLPYAWFYIFISIFSWFNMFRVSISFEARLCHGTALSQHQKWVEICHVHVAAVKINMSYVIVVWCQVGQWTRKIQPWRPEVWCAKHLYWQNIWTLHWMLACRGMEQHCLYWSHCRNACQSESGQAEQCLTAGFVSGCSEVTIICFDNFKRWYLHVNGNSQTCRLCFK